MKILLVRPDLLGTSFSLFRMGLRHMPLGLLYLGTAARQAGHEVILCDEIVGDDACEDVARHRPELVGISVSSPLVSRAAEISRRAAAAGARVVLGGPHVSALPEQTLEETGAHVAAVREGEQTLVQIASGADLADVPGVVFRQGEDFVSTGLCELVADLDDLPIPDLSLLDWPRYAGDQEYGLPGKGVIRIISSRGCASRCTFCSRHTVFTRKTRFRSADNVLAEIRANLAARPVRNLVFMDDTFTESFEHAEGICRAMIDARLDLRWAAITRVGIPRDLLQLMFRAGCQVIELGVESGSERVLRRVQKDISIQSVVETFRLARQVGMKTKAFFMVGLPGEQREDFLQSVALAKQINPDYLWLSIFLPLPGSAAFASQQGANAQYRDRTFIHSQDGELERRFREFLRKFYLRPGYLPVILKNYKGYLDMASKLKALGRAGF